ncbi:MAG: nitroreductase [Firmicutes bacterium]|nr:nitroreductase [Bacillota bacterium]
MKKQVVIFIIIAALALATTIYINASDSSVTNKSDQPNKTISLLLTSSTTRTFAAKEIDDNTLDIIIKTGIQAPSARNSQPWHFSVVKNKEILEKINNDTLAEGQKEAQKNPDRPQPPKDYHALFHAPVAIVISATTDSPSSTFDAALACENMSIAAQALGLGTHIATSVTKALTGTNEEEYKTILGIPDDKQAVAVLLIGLPDSAAASDAVSKATTRNPEVVTYLK